MMAADLMICPHCNQDEDKVIDSRGADGGHAVRRRRECRRCGRRFTTYERFEATGRLVVIKKDGSRVPFERGNILRGILAACGKRPVPEEAKEGIAEQVERMVRQEFDREVPSMEIGRRVAALLRSVDDISYIRYSSEYREFTSLEDLADQISTMQEEPRDDPGQQDLFPSKQ
jgi:transcriptional repressor NrdR